MSFGAWGATPPDLTPVLGRPQQQPQRSARKSEAAPALPSPYLGQQTPVGPAEGSQKKVFPSPRPPPTPQKREGGNPYPPHGPSPRTSRLRAAQQTGTPSANTKAKPTTSSQLVSTGVVVSSTERPMPTPRRGDTKESSARMVALPSPRTHGATTKASESKEVQKKRAAKAMIGVVDYFFTEDKKGYTCKRVFSLGGMLMAAPYKAPRLKIPPPRQTNVSVSHRDFSAKKGTSCGSRRKPLERYNPNAQRNRLAPAPIKPRSSNASQIVIGREKNPRQFVTNAKNTYRGFSGIQSTNASIIAAKTRWYHALQNL